MTAEAQQRLEAIQEATDLGAGFQLAMRDLEIRGAGNILGAEQSGHIAAVGFDLYTRLLHAAVEEARTGEATPEERPVSLDLPVTAFLPPSYVPDDPLRITLYRRIADLDTLAGVDEMAHELTDRFGPLPPTRRGAARSRALEDPGARRRHRGDQPDRARNRPAPGADRRGSISRACSASSGAKSASPRTPSASTPAICPTGASA